MSKFITVKLNELAAPGRSVISGPFGSNIGQRFFKTHGVPIIRGNNLTTDYKKFNDDGFVFLTEEKADELKSDAIKGDILFTAAGTIGQVGMIPQSAKYDRYVISNKQLRFRIDPEKADPDYVYYWLASPWIYKTIIARNTGSTVPLINLGIIKSLPVSLPKDIVEQKKIASILANIDEKIALNNRINTELEAIAKTLYDYWFVQFDFPDANGKPYKTSGGKMEYNTTLKREIPAGWRASNILSLANLLGGGTPTKTKPEYWNGSIPFFTPTDSDKNIYSLNTQDSITDLGLKNSSTRLFEKNTIFITARGSVGRLALNAVPMAMNQSCYALKAKQGVSFAFLYFLTKELINHLEVKATGSVFNSIISNDIEYTYLALPEDNGLIDKYAKKTELAFAKIELLTKENQHLIELRDWLLPLLMNGQVTVK
ncbi:subunit S of type I restriction-modification system [Klebsiella aerogenes]|uniref:restriction endonuclease subunit S n=1 Tax=Klebsiella variicola TaxID=244366 RepID=UPI000E2E31ED|nr:restriction endonuclease subunit S [Klebsiella variicola]VFT75307.1 subunit S of type I restriction-modification system [Klebsiella aerogenes]TKI26702.1 restriction endonuclease subunit S [Klebsiella variicola]SXE97055.1 subunit S of type I restriction-modification system [Klebsiella variicola]VAS33018.1 subunit S of type I restriction-modification system [Klebsiella variicola]GKM87378.1 type I restriction modification protein [Klebsiella variicola]